MRIAISTTYWPMIWPSAEPVTLGVVTGRSTLSLPLRESRPMDRTVVFGEPEMGEPMAKHVVEPPRFSRVIKKDVASGTVTVRAEEVDGRIVIADTGVEIGRWIDERCAITEGDPLSAETEMGSVFTYKKGDWDTVTEGRCRLTATKTHWVLSANLKASDHGEVIFERHLKIPIPRDLV